jgi:flagellar assembly factor FliW
MKVSDEDLGHLELPTCRQPRIGEDVLCLTIVSVQETGATANLLAPVLVNLRNRRAVQAVAQDSDYSVQSPLAPQEAAACC